MTLMGIFEPGRWMPRRNENIYEYWMSLSPAAPLFGVPWRFGEARFDALGTRTAPGTAADPASGNLVHLATARARASAPVEEAEIVAPEATAPEATAPETTEAGSSASEMPVSDAEPDPVKADEPSLPDMPAGLLAERPAAPDDLKAIKGIGPKLEAELNGLGIWHYDQIAGFSVEDLAWIDAHLTSFKGRSLRDDWIGQARTLMAA